MAMIFEGLTTCSICEGLLDDKRAYVGFPHFIDDMNHPLWRFSDSGMHQDCFLNWPHAKEFRDVFNDVWPKAFPSKPRKMLEDGQIVKVD